MDSSEKNRARMLCVFTKILGGKTFSHALESVLGNLKTLKCKVISYESSDYAKYPTPWLLNFSSTIESAWRIHNKVKDGLNGWQCDSIFFSSYHLILPFWFVIRIKKAYLSLDTTPSLAIRQSSLRSSKFGQLVANLKATATVILFRQYFRYIDVFFARTQWCADSLIQEYGVNPTQVVVTYLPVEYSHLKRKDIDEEVGNKLSLLFVGNDFERKGGQFLLDMFQEYLSEKCTLTILSSTSSECYNLPEGVTWVSGCSKNSEPSIFDYYFRADLFVFPTWNEQLGLVLCEAISTGLPVIARDVGGIRELVVDGSNGYLQSFNSSMQEWAMKILEMEEDRHLLTRYSDNSAEIAKSLLDKEKFEQLIISKVCLEQKIST
jgi:glycosyltransferase involved in cell wall biosynthesis